MWAMLKRMLWPYHSSCNFFLCLQFTWLSESDIEVISYRSTGVRRDWTVAMLPSPLDQGLWPRGQVLPGGSWHLHQSFQIWTNTHGIRCLHKGKQKQITNGNKHHVLYLSSLRIFGNKQHDLLQRHSPSSTVLHSFWDKCESWVWGNGRVSAQSGLRNSHVRLLLKLMSCPATYPPCVRE